MIENVRERGFTVEGEFGLELSPEVRKIVVDAQFQIATGLGSSDLMHSLLDAWLQVPDQRMLK